MILYNPTVSGSLLVTGSLTTTGTLTAQTLVVQTITSSVDFVTGSSVNGSLSSNTHQFTGSVLMSGSVGIGIANTTVPLTIQALSNGTGIRMVGRSPGNQDNEIAFIANDNSTIQGYFTTSNAGMDIITSVNQPMRFHTSGSERMRITASGSVGIGTSSPSGGISGNELALHLAHSNVSILALQSTAASGKKWQIYSSNDGGLYFRDGTVGTQVFNLASSGNVGIGTTSPSAILDVRKATASGDTQFNFLNSQNSTAGNLSITSTIYLGFCDDSQGVANVNKIVSGKSGDYTSAPNANSFLAFYTTAANVSAERMRISSSGNVGIGTTGAGRTLSVYTTTATQALFVHNQRNISGDYGLTMQLGGNTNNASSYYMFCDTDAVGIRMVVYGNGNVANVNNSYGAYSDIKLKENIIDATPKLDDLLKVKIRNYNLIADENKTKQIGIIAQELEEVFPGLIEESDDTVKNEETGEPIKTGTTTKSIKYSVFVPMLIKAIQELKAEIDTLKQQQ